MTTVAHPNRDAISFRIQSKLLNQGKLGVSVRFSSPRGAWGPAIDDFLNPEVHFSKFVEDARLGARVARSIDNLQYCATIDIEGGGVYGGQNGAHTWLFMWGEAPESQVTGMGGQAIDDEVKLTIEFNEGGLASAELGEGPTFEETYAASATHWQEFWSIGGAIDLGETADARAAELERRIVLSQYLTAIQNGSVPPQETGLVCNSWFGKQHLEMHWWHAAHLALWGRPKVLEKSLAWYQKILPQARAIARRQGYAGARWPKMCGPDGVSSPSGVGEFLVWQQPHVISLAELVYRAQWSSDILKRYGLLVEETARFMADFVQWDDDGVHCHLAPPLIPAQENYDRRTTRDPTFELAYWHWALSTAQKWRERQMLPRVPEWDRVLAGLPKPLIRDGRYAAVATPPFTNRSDHPSMLCAYGMLPKTPLIEPEVMLRTAKWVEEDGVWDWKSTWGWDFPVMAMTYARCGDPERAVDSLLRDTPKNTYLPNGHNYQEERLPVYLPGNGGLLAATAMMAAGWDGGPQQPAPGFPKDWIVRYEGLQPMP